MQHGRIHFHLALLLQTAVSHGKVYILKIHSLHDVDVYRCQTTFLVITGDVIA